MAALLFFAGICLGCDPLAVGTLQPPLGKTFEPGVEYLPAPGSSHVEGDPATADRALTVEWFGSDGEVASISDEFTVGEPVRLDRTDYPGNHGLIVNGVPCAGRFMIEAGRETDVILRITDDGCEVIVQRIHDEGAVVHEKISGNVYGKAAIGATIAAVSLDDPPRHAPLTVTADESGWFETGSLPPGRYRLDVRSGDADAVSVTVELEAGESEFIDLAVPSTGPGSS